MRITQTQLEQYLSKAAWILKGPVDASDFKSYIFPLLFFKRISDVYDEEYKVALEESGNDKKYASLKEFHRFLIPNGCQWKDVRQQSQNVGLKIEFCLRGIEKLNQEALSGIFGDVQWANKERLSDALLIDLIEHFSEYNLSNSNVELDILGNAYEYLIKHFADLTNKKAGEFYTPRSITHLLVMILNPKENESIYDPACGTGGMLLECANYLKIKKKNHKTLKIYGQEKNLTTNSIAKINMFFHDIEDFKIQKGDTLRNPAFFLEDNLKQFDCVIANPPFSLKDWGFKYWANDPYGRNLGDIPPEKNGDMAWIQHMIKSMKPSGRMAVVLPQGVLFRKGSELKIRKKLLEEDLLETVVKLGENIFYGTPIAPCILIFKKKKEQIKKEKIIFIDASEQLKIGRAQNFIEDEHISQIFSWISEFKNIKNYVKIVSNSDLAKNNYSLDVGNFIEKKIDEKIVSSDQALSNFKIALNEHQKFDVNFDYLLKDFL